MDSLTFSLYGEDRRAASVQEKHVMHDYFFNNQYYLFAVTMEDNPKNDDPKDEWLWKEHDHCSDGTFYNPLSGGVFINGKEISRLNTNDYRGFLALVSQEPKLYQGSNRAEWADGIRKELNYIGICQLSHTLTDSTPAGMCALPSVPCLEKIMQLMQNHQHGGFACTFDTCEEPAKMFFDIQESLRRTRPVREYTSIPKSYSILPSKNHLLLTRSHTIAHRLRKPAQS